METIAGKRVGMPSAHLSIEYRLVESLKPAPNNPRIHTERQIRKIARSIEAFGFVFPVVIRPNGQVVAGHGRVQAARLLHLSEIPTVALQHLSESQLTAVMLADNRLCEHSEWDPVLLGKEIKALSEVELSFNLEATGFEMGEISVLIEDLQPAGDSDRAGDAVPDAIPDVQVTIPGDLWILGSNRVLCGDASDPGRYLKVMGSRKASLVFTDPPYAVPISAEGEFTDFLTRIFNSLVSQTTGGSIHFVFSDWRHITEVLAAGKQAYSELKNLCVWTKDKAETGSFYRSQHELVFVFQAGEDDYHDGSRPGQHGRDRSNVWHYPRSKSRYRAKDDRNLALRATEKPVSLVADAIADCSSRGDVVLDPFLGTGTTLLAAERTGRICYGIETDPGAVDGIIRRWQTFTGLSAKQISSGQSFREREEEVANGLKR